MDGHVDKPMLEYKYINAATNGNLELLREGVNGDNVGVGDGANWTVLHFAAWNSRVAVVEWCLRDCGADPNQRKYRGETPLMMACHNGGDVEVVTTLLKYKAAVDLKNDEGHSALWFALNKKQRAKISPDGTEAYMLLVESGAALPLCSDVERAKVMEYVEILRRCKDMIGMLVLFRRMPRASSPILGGCSKDVLQMIGKMIWASKRGPKWGSTPTQ